MKKAKALLIVLCMLAAGVCYSCSRASLSRDEVTIGQREEETQASSEETCQEESLRETEEPFIYVHVCGSVASPGVYRIKAGSRIYEAIEAAGGFSEEGDQEFFNLAMEAEDGMKIEVPTTGEAWKAEGVSGLSTGEQTGGKETGASSAVNLNTATLEELMTLKGIGESRAQDIIRYRELYGPFRSIEDVMKVSGIKEGAFEKIRDDITI
jgi:competence protein ComEA